MVCAIYTTKKRNVFDTAPLFLLRFLVTCQIQYWVWLGEAMQRKPDRWFCNNLHPALSVY